MSKNAKQTININPNEYPLTKRDEINQKYKIIRTAKVGISIINQKGIQKNWYNISFHWSLSFILSIITNQHNADLPTHQPVHFILVDLTLGRLVHFCHRRQQPRRGPAYQPTQTHDSHLWILLIRYLPPQDPAQRTVPWYPHPQWWQIQFSPHLLTDRNHEWQLPQHPWRLSHPHCEHHQRKTWPFINQARWIPLQQEWTPSFQRIFIKLHPRAWR